LKILLVTYGFPPSGGGGVFRCAKFVKYATRSGAQVTVLTVAPRFYCRVQDASDSSLEREVSDARVLRVPRVPLSLSELRALLDLPNGPRRATANAACSRNPTPLQRLGDLLSFPDQEVGWLPFAIGSGLSAIQRYAIEVIYASAPPASALLVGHALARLTGKPLVAEFRDPWAVLRERPGGRSFPPESRRRRWEVELERQVVRRAERIIVVNDALASLYQETYPFLRGGRTIVIPNGYDPDDFAQAARGSVRPPEKFTITFAGSFYGNHGSEAFLRGLERFLVMDAQARSSISFQVAGSLDRRASAEMSEFKSSGLVESLGYLEHARALERMRDSSLLLLTLPESVVTEYWVPAKTYEYLATDRPILAVTPEGELRRTLALYGGVTLVDPADVEGIAAALAREYDSWRSGTSKPVDRGPTIVPTRSGMTARMLRVLESVGSLDKPRAPFLDLRGFRWRKARRRERGEG
jgi:glycosyltransferase involved in cell wall biosynthesis